MIFKSIFASIFSSLFKPLDAGDTGYLLLQDDTFLRLQTGEKIGLKK